MVYQQEIEIVRRAILELAERSIPEGVIKVALERAAKWREGYVRDEQLGRHI